MSLYYSPVYRPPSEANSLLVQVAGGCSYNKCIFCYMYKGVSYKEKSLPEILKHIEDLKGYHQNPKRAFLVGGDAFKMETDTLLKIVSEIKKQFPTVTRISSYCSALNVGEKSIEELKDIRESGVSLVYLGIESGSNKVLEGMCKGVTKEQQLGACKKLKEAGFDLSVMVISGLGGRVYSREHALETADLISKIEPKYFSLLSLELRSEALHKAMKIRFDFQMMDPVEIIDETILMLENINVSNCLFRSNHASNHVRLGGVLPDDKEELLSHLEEVKGLYKV